MSQCQRQNQTQLSLTGFTDVAQILTLTLTLTALLIKLAFNAYKHTYTSLLYTAEKNVEDIGGMITEIDTAITDMNWKASSFVSSAETALQSASSVEATYGQVKVDLQTYADGVRVLDPGTYGTFVSSSQTIGSYLCWV
jgi:hypothetical protein